MRRKIRLTEGDLHRIIRNCINEALNEIGDTERGQYALGAAQARRDMRQRQVSQQAAQNNTRPNWSNGDKSDEINRYAHNQRAAVNGGNEFNQENMNNYYKAKDMYNANQQGYRNYMSSMNNPAAQNYKTAQIRH